MSKRVEQEFGARGLSKRIEQEFRARARARDWSKSIEQEQEGLILGYKLFY
ncbi:MAG: hypothetical protein R2799_13450 [Crocinitomicaceae bacterium]